MRLPPSEVPIAFTTLGREVLLLGVDLRGQRRDVHGGVLQRRQHLADVVGRDGREIALEIDHDLGLARPDRASASPRGCGRSRRGAPGGSSRPRRHGRSRRRRSPRVSVATATRPMPAASARRITCTIIGWPAISASGLPGRRVAAMRAGISTRMRGSIIGSRAWKRGVFRAGKWGGDGLKAGSLIRVARPRANRYLNGKTRGNNAERLIPEARPGGRFGRPILLAVWGLAGNGLFRTQ